MRRFRPLAILLRTLTVLGALAFVAGTPSYAQTGAGADPDPAAVAGPLDPVSLSRDRTTIALGAALIPSYDGADSHRLIPAALLRTAIHGYAVQTRGLALYADAIRNRPGPGWDAQLGPVVGLNLDRTRRGSIDDPRVAALGTRRTAIELGGFAGLARTGVVTSDYDKLGASLTYTHDVNGAHDGAVWSPAVEYGTPVSPRAYVGLSASARHVSDRYAAYYFGVTPAGALASGLPAYTARGGWKDWSLSGVTTLALTGDLLGGLSAVGGVRYARLLGGFARAPIVATAGDRDQWSGTLGLAYTF